MKLKLIYDFRYKPKRAQMNVENVKKKTIMRALSV